MATGSHGQRATSAPDLQAHGGREACAEASTPLLHVGTDRAWRRRLFTPASWAHPAKMHGHLAQWLIERYTAPGEVILDPMGGIGSTLLALLVSGTWCCMTWNSTG